MDVAGFVAAGRTAFAEGRWAEARASFESAAATGESPEALDGLADVRYREGDYAGAIALRERAFAAFRARGETRYPAVLAAYMLAFDHVAVYGDDAVASGWLERGRRLAAMSGDCPERGWVELGCALAAGSVRSRQRHIAAALTLARRFGDTDLEFDALAYSGLALVERGRVGEGMRRIDEAAAAAHNGEVRSHMAAGEIYCKMLLACELTLDVRRAEQWVSAAERLAERSRLEWGPAICRMHYGGILIAAGRWPEAETELNTSMRLYSRSYRALRSGAAVRLADLRARQGKTEEAEHLVSGCEQDSYAVRPLARIHADRGEADVAASLLRRHLAVHGESILASPVLALLGEVEIAAGRIADAADVCARLISLTARTKAAFGRGFAAYLAGLTADDHVEMVRHLEGAATVFRQLGLPYEEARARLDLARAVAEERPSVAIAEGRTAFGVFERLGAARQADAAAALLRSLGVRGRTGPKHTGVLSRREHEVLHLIGLGLSNPEIAQRLFISRKTVSHHVSNVLAKLGVRNRAEAAVIARDGRGEPQRAG